MYQSPVVISLTQTKQHYLTTEFLTSSDQSMMWLAGIYENGKINGILDLIYCTAFPVLRTQKSEWIASKSLERR